MADKAAETTDASIDEPDETTTTEDTSTTDPTSELERLRAEARSWERRAKGNSEQAKQAKALAAELEALKASSMTDTEKAIAAARAEAAAETAKSYGARLATSAIKVAAKDRQINVDALLKRVDAAAFIGEDGEPDEAAITEWLDELAPAASPATDLGQGRRGPSTGEPTAKEIVDKARSRQAWI